MSVKNHSRIRALTRPIDCEKSRAAVDDPALLTLDCPPPESEVSMDWKSMPRMVAFPSFFGALLSSLTLQADPIGSWGGAKADVYASGLTSSQHGSDAEANAWGSTPIYYTSALVDYRPDAFNVQSASHA